MNYTPTMSPGETVTDIETVKILMCKTEEILSESLVVADYILDNIRGSIPCKQDETPEATCMLDGQKRNVVLADTLDSKLKEIARLLGV